MTAASPHVDRRAPSPALHRLALGTLFYLARRAPVVLRLIRPLAIRATRFFAGEVAQNIAANAAHILGRSLSSSERRRFAAAVIGNFYDFVVELGAAADKTPDDLYAMVAGIEGIDDYRAARAQARGAVLVTAHIGSFEVGLAALRTVEEKIHVVFKRDTFSEFESSRAGLRDKLGVLESPIDDGISSLVRLRDALQRNEVVVLQGDRAMPGQRAVTLPFCFGRLRLPTGPVKLAQLTGSPIIPVFTVREARGRFRVLLGPAIDPNAPDSAAETDAAQLAVAAAIERVVRAHPEQWLIMERAFIEDSELAQHS